MNVKKGISMSRSAPEYRKGKCIIPIGTESLGTNEDWSHARKILSTVKGLFLETLPQFLAIHLAMR